ncbi:hypothetical protein ABPG75_013442 [Micractinium tetrahymenae]
MSRGEERWEHASLAAAFTSPARSPTKRAAEAAAPTGWNESGGSLAGTAAAAGAAQLDAESPLDGWELELVEQRSLRQLGPGVRQSGWLLKAYGEGPQRVWRSRFLYLTADRLCYTADPDADSVRYLPLDRIPVRALPRGYGPKLGVTLVEDRQVDRSHPQLSPKKSGCVLSVACGSHTHFFAASSPAEARTWVEAITAAWVQCVKHTARGAHSPTAEEALVLREARWRVQTEALRRSVAEAEQARLRESTAAWQAAAAAVADVQADDQEVACYDIEVVTGPLPGAGTTSRVYLELVGAAGSSGEHRLMYREGSGRTAFAAGATDAFRLHCAPLGQLLKVRVYHSNAGPHPSWFLEEVRVRAQGAPRWTIFPCGRWLAVHQEDGRVMRELHCASTQTSEPAAAAQSPAAPASPPKAAAPAAEPEQPSEPQPVVAERLVQPTWYTVVVCTSEQEGAGLTPAADGGASPAVFVVLHGSRGSSQRIKLPSQAGDFERGQEDVFRVQLPCVSTLEKLTVGLSGGHTQAACLLDQVEVTDESTGETVFFPCSAWLGAAKGAAERSLLGSRVNPREAQREVARLRQQAEVASRQLAEAQAELAVARAAASSAEVAGRGRQEELDARLAGLQAEVAQLRKALAEVESGSAAAGAQVEALRSQLAQAEQRAAGLQREQEAGRQREGSEASRVAQLAAQVASLHDELAEAQEAAAAAVARARKCETEARRAEEALDELRSAHERHKRDSNASVADAEGELRRLRAEVAAKAAELREAKEAEAEYAAECEQLSRELAAERLRVKERVEEAERAAAAAKEAAAASTAAAATAASQPASPSATRQVAYRVCVHTSAEPAHAGTCRPVWLELVGSQGSSGAIALDRQGGAACFTPGAGDVFRLEAPDVGELQQLNIWVEAEDTTAGASGEPPASPLLASADAASWHLDSVEVAPQGRGAPRPSYFVCRKWLDARNSYRAELPASSRDPRLEEAEYKVTVFTSAIAGCGTSGNVCLDLQGDKASSGVLTLRNKGGSFRPAQADTFTFRLPSLGALSQLRVGHDGRREWHLERVEVEDTTSGTTFFFPAARWVPQSAMSRALQLRGYTTDPSSLPVRYRIEMDVEGTEGAPLPPDGLRLTLYGARSESSVQHVDASRAAPGRPLVAWFEAENVGQLERLRIGLAPAPEGQHSALLVGRIALTNMPTGEVAAFRCSEWLRTSDPYDLELDAEAEGAQQQEEVACVYRLEVQTSDVRKAGTAGSVFLTIIGEVCTIGPYQLSNTEAEHFQRGQLDVFEIDGAPDCGRLRQIEVRHDGAGRGGGWHLAWCKVTNLTTSAVAMFKCNRWVDRRSGADPGIVGVVTALPPDQAAAAAGRQRSSKDRALLGKWKVGGPAGPAAVAAAAAAKAPLVQDSRFDAELPAVEAAAPGGGQAAGPPGYRIAFHTSRICGSGTRAKIYFELTGSNGSSGVLHPVGTPRSFGAGRLDVFDYPHLPFLGELQAARVGSNGAGFFPAWHLAMLVVTHLPTGRVWQFGCYNWIDKRCHYSRWLQLDSMVHGGKAQPAGGALGWQQGTHLLATSSSGTGHMPHSPTYAGGNMHSPTYASGSPTRFAAQQQLQQGGRAGSPLRAKPPHMHGGRPGSPVASGQGWRQQQQAPYGGPHGLYSSGSGMPNSPLIGAARPRSAMRAL